MGVQGTAGVEVNKQLLIPLFQGSGSEELPDSPSDCLDDPKKTERLSGARKELVCQVRLADLFKSDLLTCVLWDWTSCPFPYLLEGEGCGNDALGSNPLHLQL